MIQHVSFEVKPDQLDACIEFYELLGFRRVTTPDKLAHFVTWLRRDGDQFHLLQLPETSHMQAGHRRGPVGRRYGGRTPPSRAGQQVDDPRSAYEIAASFMRIGGRSS